MLLRRRSAYNSGFALGALQSSMLDSIYPDSGFGLGQAMTDTYAYNAQRVNLDYLGNAYLLPKHYLAPEGISYFQNEFAADDVDWTDVSNWTVGGGAKLTYEGNGWMRLQNASSSASAEAASITVRGSDSVVGRSFSAVAEFYSADGNAGLTFGLRRASGGTNSFDNVDIELSGTDDSSAQALSTDAVTGVASNVGMTFTIAKTAVVGTTSDDLYFRFPGIIEWRTGQDTSKPPMPEDIKCFVPVGVNLVPADFSEWEESTPTRADYSYTSSAATITNDHSNGSSTGFGQLSYNAGLVNGQSYCLEFEVTAVSNSAQCSYSTSAASGSTIISSSGINAAATYRYNFTTTAAKPYVNIGINTATDAASLSLANGVSVRESAPGFYASEYTPANTVSSGVITRGTGTLLHPWHWERIGYSVPLKVKDQYDPWVADTATVQGNRRIPTTRNGYYYEATTVAGDTKTDPTTEPTWPTTIGNTVVDDQVTWTCAGYYRNNGAPIEPATTQDMATAAVLATGGSASTYPTSWAEAGDTSNILSVTGEGVSTVYPGARYIDVRVNNTSGGNAGGSVQFSSTSITGISQGDEITISAWAEIASGSVAGTVKFGVNERSAADTFLVSTFGDDLSGVVDGTLDRHSSTITVANAFADRYRPQITFGTVPDGTDFTIRITLPNSVQQSFLSSVILGQETRTSQVGALRYDIANFSVANTQIRADVSLGVAQSAIDTAHNVWSVDASSATTGVHFQSDGDLAISDGTNTAVITDWSETADTVVRVAANLISASDDLDLDVYTPTASPAGADASYADAMGTPDALTVGATTLTYPMHIHRLNAVPNGCETSVTLTSDSERYAQ